MQLYMRDMIKYTFESIQRQLYIAIIVNLSWYYIRVIIYYYNPPMLDVCW